MTNKGPSSQGYGFSSGHVWMWELDCEESWAPKNWCFWTVVLEKTLESLLDCKEIQPVHSKRDQSWLFFGRNDAEADTPVLWPPHAKSWLIGKDPDAGRDCGQEEKGMTEDEMAGWHHQLDGRESEWTPRVGDGQGGLLCRSSWGRKESYMTERLNWTDWYIAIQYTSGKLFYKNVRMSISLLKFPLILQLNLSFSKPTLQNIWRVKLHWYSNNNDSDILELCFSFQKIISLDFMLIITLHNMWWDAIIPILSK